ncbi:DNA alkylation repair protein [Agromyces italicus]|uniref:DNA alkylation repair protein n=1 Tax=Agromyces italicus TaxID=279572 RepID=UPI0003B7BC07|nr:DNA alkylation repair protein [Agromyces italicus]
MDASGLIGELEAMASEAERVKYRRYFPDDDSAPFIGVRMGAVFDLAKTALELPVRELELLLEEPTHEVRALACSIMGRSAAQPGVDDTRRTELYELYLRRHDRIDQWDLVDLAARDVIGAHLLERDRPPLDLLAASGFWPERRTALVATFAFLRRGQPDDAFTLAERLALDDAPFVQRAVGWVLRAAGDLDEARLVALVERHAATMPRIALRAAIEHLPKTERMRLLAIR